MSLNIALPTPPDMWKSGILNKAGFIAGHYALRDGIQDPDGKGIYSLDHPLSYALILMICELIKQHPEWYRAYTAMVVIPAHQEGKVVRLDFLSSDWSNSYDLTVFENPRYFVARIPSMEEHSYTTYKILNEELVKLLEALLALGDEE